jgi:hypothetical protein
MITNTLFTDSLTEYSLNSPLTSSNGGFVVKNLQVNQIVANGYLQPSPYNQTSFVVNNLNIDEGVNNIDINTNNGGGEPITITLYTPNTWPNPSSELVAFLPFFTSANVPWSESAIINNQVYHLNTSINIQTITCEIHTNPIPSANDVCKGLLANYDSLAVSSQYNILYPTDITTTYTVGETFPGTGLFILPQIFNDPIEFVNTNPIREDLYMYLDSFNEETLGSQNPPQFKLTITYTL